MAIITFNLMQLIEESKESVVRFLSPNSDTFENIEEMFHISIDGIYYEINTQKVEDYIWFHIDYGKPDPIDSNITNVITGEKKPNLRNNYEAELVSQLFVLYRYNTQTLYLSNIKKKALFEKILEQQLAKNFIVKSYFKSKDEFIETIKSIDKISFTEARDLFNTDSKKRQALKDLTGTDSPDRFTIEAKYAINNRLITFIKDLINSKEDNKLDALVIQGTDEDDFNFIFNIDSFINRIEVNCEKENNGKYISEKVKINLLNSI